jgi:hypothetical protein
MIEDTAYIKQLAGISYLGLAGVSRSCVKAIMYLLMSDDEIRAATVLTSNKSHCFLFECHEYDFVAIKSGFSSGYSGEGPTALELVLRLIEQRNIPIREVLVAPQLIARLDQSALKTEDLEFVSSKANFRRGEQWRNYVDRDNARHTDVKSLWRTFPQVISLAQIDHRIQDLVIQFITDSDTALMGAYRRLEDIVRERTDSDEIGSKLFSQAFLGASAKLTWEGLDSGERIGRGNLFCGAFMAFRNPRAHKEKGNAFNSAFSELMILNTLFRLEAEATKSEIEQNSEPGQKSL